MKNIYCQKCGEAWDIDALYNIAWDCMGPVATRQFIAGDGCPVCQWGVTAPEERPKRAEMTQILFERYGETLDFIATELDDMNKMGLLDG